MSVDQPPLHGMPTLTEVVDWPDDSPVHDPVPDADRVVPIPAEATDLGPNDEPAPVAVTAKASAEALAKLPSLDEEQLTQRVLRDLQRQIDLMLDDRLREMLTPLLARAADGLVRDVRHQLTLTLHDVVARAVAEELSRHRAG